jgi:general secretion pathway protein E
MEYFLLKSSIIGLMAQRLVRKLCTHCKEPIEVDEALYRSFNMHQLKESIEDVYNPCKAVGCKSCNFTGYTGRLPILEILPFDDKIMEKLDENRDFSDIRSLGYRSLQDDGIIKFLEGQTSIDEVMRLT